MQHYIFHLNHFSVYSLVWLSILHCLQCISETFSSCKTETLYSLNIMRLAAKALATTFLLSFSMILTTLDTA